MSINQFQNLVTSADELAELIGLPSESVIKKQLTELDEHAISFIAKAPFLVIGTVDQEGRCDVSPRGDSPAVAKVLDSRTLILPERRGNRLADSLRNVIQTGRVGLLFLIPGLGETLRVNGRACVTSDPELLATLAVRGKPPVVGIGVEVEECYFQCAKAFIRSKLWEHSPDSLETPKFDFAQVLVDQTKIGNEMVESLREQIDESYKDRLY